MKTNLPLLTKNLTILCLLFINALSYAQLPDGQNPGGIGWADSYQANGLCWCNSTFDHDLDNIDLVSFTINGVERNIADVCDELQYHPLVRDYIPASSTYDGDPIYNDIQCGNGPANTAIDETQCPGRVDLGSDGCSEIGPQWDIAWLESRARFGGTEEYTPFVPDPNKIYYIDSAHHGVRLAATGNSNDAYTTTLSTTGDDVEWQFVAKGNGYWHIQRAAGGNKPRLRRDNSSYADMQQTTSSGSWTYYEITTGDITNSYFLTLPDSPTTNNRLQINNSLEVKTVASANHNGTWESFKITEASSLNDDGSTLVHITKRNATGYAIDGGNGGANLQDVTLSSANTSDEGQLWNEIDRGNGYYSYEKYGTNYSLDGNGGGANNQSVYLWETSDTNQNQQWQKVAMGDGGYKLIKRNATGFAINGGSGGLEGRDINLYDSGNSSKNLQWYITPISANLQSNKETEVISTISDVIMYPNPVNNITTIKGAANSNIIIYDINGRIVLKKSILIESEVIDLSNLTYGIYYAKVIGVEKSTTIKLIKN